MRAVNAIYCYYSMSWDESDIERGLNIKTYHSCFALQNVNKPSWDESDIEQGLNIKTYHSCFALQNVNKPSGMGK